MTTYISIASTETDPEAPLTSELAKKWTDNVLAIQEGDATAPKVQPNALRRKSYVSGAAAQTQTFVGLGTANGVEFTVYTRMVGAGGTLNFQWSDDTGATWSTAQSIGNTPPTTGGASYTGSFDFATGVLKCIMIPIDPPAASLTALVVTDVTLAGASGAINQIRFQGNNANLSCLAHIYTNGGTD
jgi:hypothetical protein